MTGKLKETTLTDSNGFSYVQMLVPENMAGLEIAVDREYPRYYEGNGYPFRYLITFRSTDPGYQMGVFSGRSYTDDHLMSL